MACLNIYIRGWSHLEQEARYTMDILLVNLFKFCSNKAILMFSYICNSMTYNIMCCCTLSSGHSKWEVTCFCYSHIRRQGARHPSDYRKCLNSTKQHTAVYLKICQGPYYCLLFLILPFFFFFFYKNESLIRGLQHAQELQKFGRGIRSGENEHIL